MSPLLFSLFIDDLEMFQQDNIECSLNIDDTLLFADEMAILAKTPEDLQTSLDLLHTYCSNLGLEVNTTSKPRVRYWEIT